MIYRSNKLIKTCSADGDKNSRKDGMHEKLKYNFTMFELKPKTFHTTGKNYTRITQKLHLSPEFTSPAAGLDFLLGIF